MTDNASWVAGQPRFQSNSKRVPQPDFNPKALHVPATFSRIACRHSGRLSSLSLSGLFGPVISAHHIVRKRLGLQASLYQTLQILSVTLFEETPILCALQAFDAGTDFVENVNQLILFDL